MSLKDDLERDERIAQLESKTTKQQAEINRMITINEQMTATIKKMAAALETISAGK